MLHLPLKTTEKVELNRSLYRFVEAAYSSQQAEDHRAAFNDTSQLRERVRNLTHNEKGAAENVRTIARYHRLLTIMRTRFGGAMEDSGGSEPWTAFPWRDAFKSSDKVSRSELAFETASVLFNLASALSYSATLEDRSTPTGLRAACQAFQHAAGALDLLSPLAASAEWPSSDLHPRAVGAWQQLMLAQAQLCFYEKALTDQMKPAVVAKLAAQVGASFEAAASALKHKDVRGAHKDALDGWASTLETQQKVFEAWALYHAAREHEDKYEYGSQVARLGRAASMLADATKASATASTSKQGVTPLSVHEANLAALETISKLHKQAAHLNDNVYNERVPNADALPAIVPKQIVKPVPITDLHLASASAAGAPSAADAASSASAAGGGVRGSFSDGRASFADGRLSASEEHLASGEDPFQSLVPVAVLSELSVYTARRDDVLRELGEQRDDIAQLLASELASMDLPQALEQARHDATIPPPLCDALARLCEGGGAAQLYATLDELGERARDCESLAMSVDATLEVEEGADLQLQQAHGDKWHALPSASLNADTREELSTLRSKLGAAATADAALREALHAREALLEPLSLPLSVLQEQVPQPGEELFELACVKDMHALLQSLDTTARAIDATIGEARAATADKDVAALTDKLVHAGEIGGGSSDEIITDALVRLTAYCGRLSDEAAQQESLLGALRTANEAFTHARFTDPMLDSRNAYFASLGQAVLNHHARRSNPSH